MPATTSGATRSGVGPAQTRHLVAGVVLAVGAAVVVLVSESLDLGVESVALLGVGLGAVLALVPDTTAARRLAGGAVGFVVALVGYLVRAGYLPDSPGGRAVAVAVVVLLCVGLVAAARGRLPLWATLLGAAALAGAYESTFAAAPARVLETSVSSATSLALAAAVGFTIALLAGPAGPAAPAPEPRRGGRRDDHTSSTRLDDMMETPA